MDPSHALRLARTLEEECAPRHHAAYSSPDCAATASFVARLAELQARLRESDEALRGYGRSLARDAADAIVRLREVDSELAAAL